MPYLIDLPNSYIRYKNFTVAVGEESNKIVNKAVKKPPSRASSAASVPDFLVHDDRDDAGVVVVEGVESGQMLCGWFMETDRTTEIKTLGPIPLGHKVALRDIAEGDDVLKYGEVIGRACADIPAGSHLHVHNTKTKKW